MTPSTEDVVEYRAPQLVVAEPRNTKDSTDTTADVLQENVVEEHEHSDLLKTSPESRQRSIDELAVQDAIQQRQESNARKNLVTRAQKSKSVRCRSELAKVLKTGPKVQIGVSQIISDMRNETSVAGAANDLESDASDRRLLTQEQAPRRRQVQNVSSECDNDGDRWDFSKRNRRTSSGPAAEPRPKAKSTKSAEASKQFTNNISKCVLSCSNKTLPHTESGNDEQTLTTAIRKRSTTESSVQLNSSLAGSLSVIDPTMWLTSSAPASEVLSGPIGQRHSTPGSSASVSNGEAILTSTQTSVRLDVAKCQQKKLKQNQQQQSDF